MVGRPVIVALVLIVGTGLSACSGSDDRATPPPTTPSTAPTTTTTTTAPTTTPAPPATVPESSGTDFATRDPFEPQG